MIGIFQNNNNNNQNSIIQEYLPTPQISSVGAKDKSFYHLINQLNWRNQTISDVLNIAYKDDYYIQLFDIYFNSFGNDRQFLSLPDLKLELCRVTQKKQSGWSSASVNNNQGLTGGNFNTSQKDYGVTQIVHSSNLLVGGSVGTNITDTIFSGGNGTYMQTEWVYPDTNIGFENKFNNPVLRVEIDYKNFINSTQSGGSYNSYKVFPCSANNGDWFKSRGSHSRTIPKNLSSNKHRYYVYNTILYFRLSAGVEGTLDSNTGVYQKRIYSDLSIPIYFCPQVRKFYNTPNDNNSGGNSIIYHYKIGLGNKV